MSGFGNAGITLSLGMTLLLCGIGCRGIGSVVDSRKAGEGTTRMYPVTEDQAWEISKAVLRWEDSNAIEEHRSEGYMLTSIGANLVSWGAVCGVWIESVDGRNTEVTVVSKRRLAMNLATTMTEGRFHTLFERGMKLAHAGKPLPDNTPPSQ